MMAGGWRNPGHKAAYMVLIADLRLKQARRNVVTAEEGWDQAVLDDARRQVTRSEEDMVVAEDQNRLHNPDGRS